MQGKKFTNFYAMMLKREVALSFFFPLCNHINYDHFYSPDAWHQAIETLIVSKESNVNPESLKEGWGCCIFFL